MVDVAEVVVRATPEGLQNTTDQVDEMSDGVEDSTDEMDEQAGAMSKLSKRFSGAMGAVMTGMAVAAAGLLSQVPVIGELMGGLGAIIDALAFRLDSLLRPTFGPIVDRLFDFADAIFEADGALGTFIDILLVAGTVLGTAAGVVLTVTKVLAPLLKSLGVLVTIGKIVVGVIAGVISVIGAIPLAIAAAVVGLGLLIWHFREGIVNAIKVGIDAFTDFVSGLGDMISDGMSRITDFVSDVSSAFGGLVRDAFGWGRDVMVRFIAGFRGMLGALRDVLDDIPFIGRILDLFDAVVDALKGNDMNVSSSLDIGGGGIGGAVSSAAQSGADFVGSVGGGGGATFLDGRRVDSNQGRFRKDSLTRRGG